MSKKRTYRMALNPATHNLEWAPADPRPFPSAVGWLLMAVSTLLFVAVVGYFAYLFLLSSPRFDVTALPGGGPSVLRDEVVRLR